MSTFLPKKSSHPAPRQSPSIELTGFDSSAPSFQTMITDQRPGSSFDCSPSPGRKRASFVSRKKKERTSFGTFSANVGSSMLSTFRSRDIFGQPISLNIQGNETFQTCPGGLLSIVFYICLLSYTFLKLNIMVNKKDWEISTQQVITPEDMLKEQLNLSNPAFANLSLSVQFQKKRPVYSFEKMQAAITGEPYEKKPLEKLSDDQVYSMLTEFIARYLRVDGMLEEKKRGSYSPFGNVTEDLINWKQYPKWSSLRPDGQYEIKFNLSDMVLRGTPAQQDMGYLIPRFQLRTDFNLLTYDAFRFCTKDPSIDLKRLEMFIQPVDSLNKDLSDDLSKEQKELVANVEYVFSNPCETILTDTPIDMLHKLVDWSGFLFPLLSASEKTAYNKRILRFQAAIEKAEDPTVITEDMMDLVHEYYTVALPLNFKQGYLKYVKEVARMWFAAVAIYPSLPDPVEGKGFDYSNEAIGKLSASDFLQNSAILFQQGLFNPELLQRFIEVFESAFPHITGYENRRARTRIVEQNRQLTYGLQRMKTYYENFHQYINTIEAALDEFSFQLMVEDEIETFREWDDPQFSYPYGSRSTQIGEYVFSVSDFKVLTQENFLEYFLEAYSFEEFQYSSAKLKLQRSQTCLEGNAHDQLNFVWEFFDLILRMVGASSKSENSDQCETEQVDKLRLSTHLQTLKSVSEDYDRRTLSSKILLEVELGLDQFTMVNKRTSTQVLDFFGDVGGFKEALFILFSLFGEFFSSRLFLANIAAVFFRRRKTPTGQAHRVEGSIADGFEPIQVSTIQALTDGLISTVCPCSKARERVALVERCHSKFEEHLDVSVLLKKINECNALLEKLKTTEIDDLLKTNKFGVIQTSSSDDEEEQFSLAPPDAPILKEIAAFQSALTAGLVQGSSLPKLQRKELLEEKFFKVATLTSTVEKAKKKFKSLRNRRLPVISSGTTPAQEEDVPEEHQASPSQEHELEKKKHRRQKRFRRP